VEFEQFATITTKRVWRIAANRGEEGKEGDDADSKSGADDEDSLTWQLDVEKLHCWQARTNSRTIRRHGISMARRTGLERVVGTTSVGQELGWNEQWKWHRSLFLRDLRQIIVKMPCSKNIRLCGSVCCELGVNRRGLLCMIGDGVETSPSS
jgi:hypothetical protein